VKVSSNEGTITGLYGGAQLNENMGQLIIANGSIVHVVYEVTEYEVAAAQIHLGGLYYTKSTDTGATWSTPHRLSPSPSNWTMPLIATSGSYIHVVFMQQQCYCADPASTSWYMNSPDAGTTWSTPMNLGTTWYWPAVAAVGNYVYVALSDILNPGTPSENSEVFFLRSTNAGTNFGPVTNLSNAPGRSEDPAMSASGSNVYVAWNDNRPTETAFLQLYFMSSSNYGVTWTTPMPLTSSAIQSYSPACFANPAQPAYVVAGSAISSPTGVHVQISSNSGNSFALNLSITTAQCLYPQFAIDYPNLYMACQGWPNGPPFVINYTSSPDWGVTWTQPITVVSDPNASPNVTAKPFISVSAGVLHMIYWNLSSDIGQIWYIQNTLGAAGATSAPTPQRNTYNGAPEPQMWWVALAIPILHVVVVSHKMCGSM